MWKLKYDANELIHETGSRLISRLVVAKGKKGVSEGRMGALTSDILALPHSLFFEKKKFITTHSSLLLTSSCLALQGFA